MIDLSKNILYEDADMLVINKPAGLVVHPDGRTKELSVSEWFATTYPDSKDVGESIEKTSGEVIERAGVVHRLDRETSGILLLAKTHAGHAYLKEQFQNREVEKTYHVFVYGLVKDDRGSINLPIKRSSGDFRKWSAQRGGRGEEREALTYFEVLKRDEVNKVTFIEAKPKTGRTHQIRVHFQAIQHPILGDKLYGPKIVPQSPAEPWRSGGEVGQIFERTALHARKISFKNLSGEKISIEAPYPDDFQKALEKLGN